MPKAFENILKLRNAENKEYISNENIKDTIAMSDIDIDVEHNARSSSERTIVEPAKNHSINTKPKSYLVEDFLQENKTETKKDLLFTVRQHKTNNPAPSNLIKIIKNKLKQGKKKLQIINSFLSLVDGHLKKIPFLQLLIYL